MTMPKAVFNWSGGKDSSIALYHVLKDKEYDIPYLLTSINEKYQRISMHGVRVDLLEAQAESIGLPLLKLQVPEMPSMDDYNRLMFETLNPLNAQGINLSIFGDIFLEDLREYREGQLARVDMKGVFPIWKCPTDRLAKEFIDLGFKAVTVCVNDKYLDKSFVGREMDAQFFKDLPDNVDPCGENGEFHSFVYAGPIFKKPIVFEKGEVVYRKYEPACQSKEDNDEEGYQGHDDVFDNGFWYCDLIQ